MCFVNDVYVCDIQVINQINMTVTEITGFVRRNWSFTLSGVELLSIGLLFSVKTRTVPVETLRNRLDNSRNDIFPDGVLLRNRSSIEVLAFQPNCK